MVAGLRCISVKGAYKSMLAVSVLGVLALSGCFGGGAEEKETPATSTGPSVDNTATSGPSGTEDLSINDPKRHFHHYWGEGPKERDFVDVFYMDALELEQDAFEGGQFGCRSVGHREFDLETDGDEAHPQTDEPIHLGASPNPRADTVFAGTSHLEVNLLSAALGPLPSENYQVHLRYKPANLNFYQPENGCGVELETDEPFMIPVGPGQSDPPHQFYVSRWSFFVIVTTDQGEASGGDLVVPAIAQGSVGIQITAYKGDEKNLDPAHPDLWDENGQYDLGCTSEDSIARQIVTWAPEAPPVHRPPQEPIADISWEYGRIVPLQTRIVEISLDVSNSGTLTNGEVELWYYGADTNRYARAESTGDGTYEIIDADGIKADPPYEDETLWRFMIVPLPLDGAEADGSFVADFEGSFTLCAKAFRDPAAPPLT